MEPGTFQVCSQHLFLVLAGLIKARFLDSRPVLTGSDGAATPDLRVEGGLLQEQRGVCAALREQAERGRTQFFVHAPTGSGKTGATLSHLEYLLAEHERTRGRARYVLLLTVSDA